MRPFVAFAALLALAVGPATRADITAPSDFYPIGVPLSTIFESNGARQYQQYLGRDLFPQQSLPLLITGLQVRLPAQIQTLPFPTNDTTYFNYIIQIGEASAALKLSGGQFNPAPPNTFAMNMVNPVTVYSGPLTLPAGAFVPGVRAQVIPFNVSNFVLQPNTYYVVYINHTISDQMAGTNTPGFDTASSSTTLGQSSAVYARDNVSLNFTSSADPYKINFVTSPQSTNISTRGNVGTGANIMIGGFIITGPTPKKVILRAIGPSLAAFGVPNTLSNPALLLFKGPTPLANNDNWGNLSAADQATLLANNLAPGDPRESALVQTLAPGAYTAQVIGVAGTTGNALVEVYDIDPLSPSTLTNISTRAAVGINNDVTIAGFIVKGDDSNILIRGIGPSLTAFGVPGALADPTLELHNAAGAIITSNDNWQTQSAGNGTPQAIINTGMAPTFGKESAILRTLPAGAYTCILRGAGGTTGVGLIEVFQIQ